MNTREPAVALTFDDGPDPVWTPRLLEVLEAHGARATFFMVGANAKRYPGLVDRVACGGHSIGNHSWDHPSFPLISRAERLRQLKLCSDALGARASRLFRPPYGHQTIGSRLDVWRAGYRVVTWSVVEPDWLNRGGDTIAAGIQARMRPGSIVLLHDSQFDAEESDQTSREQTVEAVEILLSQMDRRFRFVSVPELLWMGRPRKHLWLRTADAELLQKLQRMGMALAEPNSTRP